MPAPTPGTRTPFGLPGGEGLYDPSHEHDGCGIGFVAHMHGERSHDVVRHGLRLLENLSHRGAVGGDAGVGDGAGILIQLPHAHLARACRDLGIGLPDAGAYGVGMFFLPRAAAARRRCETLIDGVVVERGFRVLGWRDVPTDDRVLAEAARKEQPAIRQLFVAPAGIELSVDDPSALERRLFLMRRRIERALDSDSGCHVVSLSSRTVVYKGLLRPDQVASFYPELADAAVMSGLALVHGRFSTNTFPTWPLAHPYRLVCHNGEINTIRGNVGWMRVREEQMASERLGENGDTLAPVIAPGQSDSASFDNALELLLMSGRSLAHAMMMLIPEAWEGHATMSPERRAFYEYHASLMEPWDGPAAIAFTDGRQIGAVLDRNGLRPARYVVTTDDLVVLASEAGALPFPAENIRSKGRLQPGKMLVVNTTQGRLLDDEEIKAELVTLRPYRRWLTEQRVDLVPRDVHETEDADPASLTVRQQAFGYTREDLQMILAPMAEGGTEPVGSMGNDAPLAVLSDRPQLLFSYFRQLFAQVTNPPIDPLRERLVMSLRTALGPMGNVLDETPEHARQIVLEQPILSREMLAALSAMGSNAGDGMRSHTLPALFPAAAGPAALEASVEALCRAATDAVRGGAALLILTDRSVGPAHAAIPSLLAASAVHHHLVRERLRSRVSLIVDAGDAREVPHIALLIAFGASAVHPRVALRSVAAMADAGLLRGVASAGQAVERYTKAVGSGLLKVLSKMGISTIQGYRGAQLAEAVGLSRDLLDRHFTGTASRVGGIGLALVADEVLQRHRLAFTSVAAPDARLESGGNYHFRIRGEHHQWNPETISTLQHAVRTGDAATFREFSRMANDVDGPPRTLRALLDFADADHIPLADVEPATAIVRRFVTGAMSYGSLSREAHETLAVAMNRLGGRSNTGEGGEDRARFGTDRNSAIKQVASGRFGVTTEYLVNADELQIKVAQGAKPGEGGQLPGHKVDATIAATRFSTPGVTLISPPPHHDIYSIEDLKQLIYDLKSVNPEAAISVKLVSEAGVGTVAAGVAKAHADLIVISGDSGGTGASPLSSIKHAGVPWELGLAEAQQTLVLNDLRGAVRLQVDGQLRTGRDVAIAALLGAEEFGFATAPLIAEGCVMMRKCHLNTCPVGIATQDPVLREKFTGQPEHVINYLFFVADEVREIMARLGFRTMDAMIGQAAMLRQRAPETFTSTKARTIDLSSLLHVPAVAIENGRGAPHARRHVRDQRHGLDGALDHELIALAAPALERGERVRATADVRNVHRAVGARLSGEIARRYGHTGLPDGTITVALRGSAGQSFGAFAARGLTLALEGEANDFVGKGLSGGRLTIRAPKGSPFLPDDAVIIGNTALYGAIDGEAFIGGVAGERFAVRNSGATAVVEGIGDHGCEYMTGGTVVVLGPTGRNFAAGMSGGIAFVLDEAGLLAERCNHGLVALEPVVHADDRSTLRHLVERQAALTDSARARRLLARWEQMLPRFVLVIPEEYKRIHRGMPAAARAAQGAARYA